MRKQMPIGLKFFITVLMLLALAVLIGLDSRQAARTISEGVTLKEAVLLSFPRAQIWSKNAKLAYAISTDSGTRRPNYAEGTDGRRRSWNIIYVESEKGGNLLTAVRNGSVAYAEEVQTSFQTPLDIDQIRYDSPCLLTRLNAVGVINPGYGIHFELINPGRPVLRIYTRDSQGRYHIYCFDEVTGKSYQTAEPG